MDGRIPLSNSASLAHPFYDFLMFWKLYGGVDMFHKVSCEFFTFLKNGM